ncbi:MAG: hypothetical protein A3D75_01705 [Candidatus Levybacteria bacterium RIFCSPHIGHO2_02_FULL_37_18]|nr:MAG: hypothetical protein A2770_02080 [Candidatus Levybacteria bacterium RIFCSPHIGHO2_01_FULL_38_12]OGH22271.1 MAG: hypothetical protein A3D75_01705 [Candidatus Levybacteria bacterium RIFCSPHIGHO2_02_FULL_37_18]
MLFLVVLCLLQNVSKSYALENFDSSYNVTYTVGNDGITTATYDILLKNKTSQLYAQSYRIDVGLEHVKNIKSFDTNAGIVPTVIKNEKGSSITVDFNKKVTGLRNQVHFTLSFQTDEIAKKLGNIWEITIPGISHQEDFSSFTVHLTVPEYFGTPSYIKPSIQAKNSSTSYTSTFDFSKEQLGKNGISLAFGKEQFYDFTLLYHIQNKNIFSQVSEIALPLQTNYQDVYISDITPKPQSVVLDSDGNWKASYLLNPSERKTVGVKGKVKVSLLPKKQVESEDALKQYVQSRSYWQSTDEEISNLANTLKTPKNIYDYVTSKLSYDSTRVSQSKPRLGAKNVLKNPSSAVCLEFTDLFIALARAAGIPAREVDGFAYTQNFKQRPLSLKSDILHAWPEYYDKDVQRWIMVDPTWENTSGVDYFYTFDLDHVAFVIKGRDSMYPVSPGGYKDVKVVFSRNVLTNISSIDTIPTAKADISFSPFLFIVFIPIIGGGIFLGICSFFISKVAGTARNLSFFRQKR